MNAAGRLGLYAAGMVVAFTAAFGVAAAVVPPEAAAEWNDRSGSDHSASERGTEMDHSSSSGHTSIAGVSMSAGGYALSPVQAPGRTDEAGELSFRILTPTGEPLTDFATAHDKELHLIVVRSDGAEFRHVHPTLDEATGTWSLPWEWSAAGAYRVYADFTPGIDDAEGLTLSTTVHVAGDLVPVAVEPSRVSAADEFTASIEGDLVTGSTNDLTISIRRGGEPVTDLQPYLGAFGHLVALREGDLAYLHVHPDADDPEPGATSGPDISFMAEPPTPGRYLLYLDFQVDGEVHTAQFVLEATAGADSTGGAHDDEDSHGH